MSSFIGMCNCRGHRPDGIISQRHYSRPDLIARLLRERHVARCIVAPTGFGKSSLAYEYADVVFGFQHVFWINGKSPCFLRDLDAGILFSSLMNADSTPHLAVIDDVPMLSDDRAHLLGQFVDMLLEAGCEVIVTCTPSADSMTYTQRDRVLLRGDDLLLSDDEMLAEEISGRLTKGWDDPDSHVSRIACLRWGSDDFKTLIGGLKSEDLPADVRLAMLALFVLQAGSLDDLRMFLPAERSGEIVALLDKGYSFFGIDIRQRTYYAIDVDLETLTELFCSRVDDFVAPSLHDDKDALCQCLADALLARGESERACAFIHTFATKPAGALWLLRKGWEVLACMGALSFCDLYDEVRRSVNGYSDVFASMHAWATLILDDSSRAYQDARRVAQYDLSAPTDRASALILLLRIGDAEARGYARNELVKLLEEGNLLTSENTERNALKDGTNKGQSADTLNMDIPIDWEGVARVALALENSLSSAHDEWQTLLDHARISQSAKGVPMLLESDNLRCSLNALLLTGSWILDAGTVSYDDNRLLLSGSDASDQSDVTFAALKSPADDLNPLIDFIIDLLDEEASNEKMSWFSFCAGISLERLAHTSPHLVKRQLSFEASVALHEQQGRLFEQQDNYRRHRHVREEQSRTYRMTHPDEFRADATHSSYGVLSNSGIPTLYVSLFGGIEVHIGDKLVDPEIFNRRKTKALLALLILNHGREVSKDRMVSLLWSESKIELARKNFYTVWSQLRQALSLHDERGCPYLVRTRTGCRIDMRFVTSDVFVFEGLCRTLMFGTTELEGWENLYSQVCGEFSEDFMAGELDNTYFRSQRQRFGMQLVDGLIAASTRLRQQGEPRGALWFAREALRRDAAREDVYVALMEAQIASNQRAAALDTYFACRRFLTEELGIDPSPRIMELYHSVIEIEEDLV